MNDKKNDALIGKFYGISSAAVLLGAFFKLQHYPYGIEILIGGFVLGTIVSFYDTYRLKKKVKRLEEQLKVRD